MFIFVALSEIFDGLGVIFGLLVALVLGTIVFLPVYMLFADTDVFLVWAAPAWPLLTTYILWPSIMLLFFLTAKNFHAERKDVSDVSFSLVFFNCLKMASFQTIMIAAAPAVICFYIGFVPSMF